MSIAIPVHDERLPGSHAIFDFADFDTRYYKWVQTYEPEAAKDGTLPAASDIEQCSDDWSQINQISSYPLASHRQTRRITTTGIDKSI